MSKKDKKSLWKEFTEFAIKGNAMALAVGTIIGGAFGTITKAACWIFFPLRFLGQELETFLLCSTGG